MNLNRSKKQIMTTFVVLLVVVVLALLVSGVMWASSTPTKSNAATGKKPVATSTQPKQSKPNETVTSDTNSGRDSAQDKPSDNTADVDKSPSETGTAVKPTVPNCRCASGESVKRYTVVEGDTLSDVSRKTGISVDAIAKANCIRNVDLIYAGSTLVIPASNK